MKQKRVERAIQEARDQKSMEVFNKHESELTSLERDELDDWMNPRWKTWYELTYTGRSIEVSNVGTIRYADDKKPVKIVYPKNNTYSFISGIVDLRTNRRIPRHVHRMVATLFIPNPDNKPEVNHIDGDKWNNWYRNLEWVTKQENEKHAIMTGLVPDGENHPRAKYTDEQIQNVCELLRDHPDWTYPKISELTGVNRKTVEKVHRRETWKSISKSYTFPNKINEYTYSGSNNGNAKYTDEQAEQVCQLLDQVYHGKAKLSTKQIADKVGVSIYMVYKIYDGTNWTHVSSRYDFYKTKFGG